jgi:hypothetical protein
MQELLLRTELHPLSQHGRDTNLSARGADQEIPPLSVSRGHF